MQPLDHRKRDGVRGVETLERAEGIGDNFGIFVTQPMKNGGRRCDDKGRLEIARRHIGNRSCWIAIDTTMPSTESTPSDLISPVPGLSA
jgi:hypothetical protein